MATTYELVTPTLIPNTRMEKMFTDGVHKTYKITPNAGYLLHDIREDDTVFYNMENETGEYVLRFSSGDTTVRYDYDFTTTTQGTYTCTDENGAKVDMPVTKIGEFEFFAVEKQYVINEKIY